MQFNLIFQLFNCECFNLREAYIFNFWEQILHSNALDSGKQFQETLECFLPSTKIYKSLFCDFDLQGHLISFMKIYYQCTNKNKWGHAKNSTSRHCFHTANSNYTQSNTNTVINVTLCHFGDWNVKLIPRIMIFIQSLQNWNWTLN